MLLPSRRYAIKIARRYFTRLRTLALEMLMPCRCHCLYALRRGFDSVDMIQPPKRARYALRRHRHVIAMLTFSARHYAQVAAYGRCFCRFRLPHALLRLLLRHMLRLHYAIRAVACRR